MPARNVAPRMGIAAAVVALVACGGGASPGRSGGGSSGGSSSASSSATSAAAASPCSILTAGLVAQVMGSGFSTPQRHSVGNYDACQSTSSSDVMVSLALPPQPAGMSQSDVAKSFHDGQATWSTAQTVTGVGDAAYCAANGTEHILFLLSGRTVAEITADSCDHARALAALIVSHL